jgi:hypothetical protein
MKKIFIFALTFIFTVPVSAMRVSKLLTRMPGAVHRNYALISKAEMAQLWDKKGNSLKPKEFARTLAALDLSHEDLRILRGILNAKIINYYAWGQPLLDDLSGKDYTADMPFFKQDSIPYKISSSIGWTALGTCILGIPLTICAATGSLAGEAMLLVLKAVEMQQVAETVQHGVGALETCTAWSARAVVGGGAITFPSNIQLVRELIKPYGHYCRMNERNKKNLKYVEGVVSNNERNDANLKNVQNLKHIEEYFERIEEMPEKESREFVERYNEKLREARAKADQESTKKD